MRPRRTTALVVAATLALAVGVLAAFHGHRNASASTSLAAGRPGAAVGASPDLGAGTARTGTPTVPAPSSLLTPGGTYLGGKYLGVALPGGASGLPAFTEHSGTRPDLSEVFTDLGAPFPAAAAAEAWSQGAETLISWMSMDQTLAAIAAGDDDAQLRAFAAGAKAYAAPVFVDFDHEFNGDWYPWGTQAAGAAQFVAAWRHVHEVVTAAGATNIEWVWSPNVVNPVPDVDLAAYWPGPAYVDVVGIVGYFTDEHGEDTYQDLFGRTEAVVDAFAHKPFLITESGAQQGPDKAAWVADLLTGVRTDTAMLGLVYFDEGSAQGKRDDWTLEDDPAALAAWRAGATALSPVGSTQ